MRLWVVACLSMPCLSGCQTSLDYSRSYVEPQASTTDAQLGYEIARYVSDTWPAARTRVVMVPPQRSEPDNELTKALTMDLLNAGFAILTPDSAHAPNAHRLKYCVTADDRGILVRLVLDEAPVARYYALGPNGELLAISALTVSN